jgi:hypothetical protein
LLDRGRPKLTPRDQHKPAGSTRRVLSLKAGSIAPEKERKWRQNLLASEDPPLRSEAKAEASNCVRPATVAALSIAGVMQA